MRIFTKLLLVICLFSCGKDVSKQQDKTEIFEDIMKSFEKAYLNYNQLDLSEDFSDILLDELNINKKSYNLLTEQEYVVLKNNVNRVKNSSNTLLLDYGEFLSNKIKYNEINELEYNSKKRINIRSTPCTERFEVDEQEANNAAAAVALRFGPAAGLATYTYMIWTATDNWCSCMESTYGVGCDSDK